MPRSPQHHPTQWVGDRTCEWLKTAGQGDKSFFLFSSFIHPHPPFSPPTPWHKLYRGPDMPLPKMAEDNKSLYLHTNYRQNRYKGRDAGRDIRLHQLIKSYYWAAISFIDFQVGRMLQTLEETGQLDNTLIIFTSDRGEFLGDYNCFGKRSFLDSAARVPMICRLPGTFDAGVDGFFHLAGAKIISFDTVELLCSEVEEIVAVRYAFHAWVEPPTTLQNSNGLPAEPFRIPSSLKK